MPYSSMASPSSSRNDKKLLVKKTITTSKTNNNVPKYQATLDIMSDNSRADIDNIKKSKVTHAVTHEIVKKTNIPLSPKRIEPNSVETRKEKDQIMSEIKVQPLTEFPTDGGDELHSLVEKDAIPRPNDLQLSSPETHEMVAKDSIDDVPFSSTIEPLQHSFFPGLSDSNTTSSSDPQNIQPSSSSSSFLPQSSSNHHQRRTFRISKLYSLLYPLSTIQRQSFQKLFLESKNSSHPFHFISFIF